MCQTTAVDEKKISSLPSCCFCSIPTILLYFPPVLFFRKAFKRATGTMNADSSDETADMLEERLISSEHKIWLRNSQFFYEYVVTHVMDWPSLTCQWLPGQKPSSNEAMQHQLLLGTHTATGEQNYLMVATCRVPTENAKIDICRYDDEGREVGGFGFVDEDVGTVEITTKIKHEGEVNRARYMPQNPKIIATRGPSAELFIWNLAKHPAFPSATEKTTPVISPQGICKGHTKEGYALEWSPHRDGMLLSGAEDTKVMLWDARDAFAKNSMPATPIAPLKTFSAHQDMVEDVAWHAQDPNLIGSVGDDRFLCLWDIREEHQPMQVVKDAHPSDVNCLAFHPKREFILASGGADSSVAIWDMRNMAKPINILRGHSDQVFKLEWSPSNESILASCSADRRVALWDLARIGEKQSIDEAEDGPPELLFLHGGHTGKVSDFSWNLNKDFEWTIASVSNDNVLQIWNPAEDIYAEGGDGMDDNAV